MTPADLKAALVEAGAREIFAACDGGDPDRLTRFAPDGGPAWTLYRSAARDALSAIPAVLERAGHKAPWEE